MKPTTKKIIAVLTALLTDFKDEVGENTEYKIGDSGSWTENIFKSENLLRELKGKKPISKRKFLDKYCPKFKKNTVKFEFKGVKYTYNFTPNEQDYWEAFSFGNKKFDLNYDEAYNFIVVYEVDRFGDTLTGNTLHRQKIDNSKPYND